MNAEDLGVGSVIGGFQIESVLGKGGMGVVYKAHELSLNRKVALKVLSQKLSSDQEFIQRFKREAQVIAALEHPNIVRILSYGEEEGVYYFAMDYIQGKDLGQILKEKSAIPLEEALAITGQVASALVEADIRGVVHRDLKPTNIMIDEKGKVRITDFGVAHLKEADTQLTRTGWFLGTPEFASPEQAGGAPLDVRSDIYSLGAVLYWMLVGKPPVTGDSPQAVLIKIATEPLPPIQTVNPSVPEPVRRLVEKMTAKDPIQRFQKPKELLAAIDDCNNRIRMVPQPSEEKVRQEERKPGRSYAKVIGSILGIALVIFLIVWVGEALFLKRRPPAEPAKVVEAPKPEETKSEAMAVVPSAPIPASPEIGKAAAEKAPSVPGKRASGKKVSPFREIPSVLVVVSGDESMAGLVRSHLESIVMRSGLKVTPVTDIPELREKVQHGGNSINYSSMKEVVPPGKTDILLMAQIQKAGSTELQYYGRSQELTTATFTVQAVDLVTGKSVKTSAGSAKFTSLNMEENIKEAVFSVAGGVGEGIRKYWEERLSGSRRGG